MQITPPRSLAALTLLASLIGCTPTPKAQPTTAPLDGGALPSPVITGRSQESPPPVTMSVTTTAPAVLPPELKFSAESIKAIQAGTKTATVRKGTRTFPNGVIKAVGTNSDALVLTNVVATPRKLSGLTETDAKLNGSGSLEELKADIERDYPGIEPDDVVTVITFRPSPIDPAK